MKFEFTDAESLMILLALREYMIDVDAHNVKNREYAAKLYDRVCEQVTLNFRKDKVQHDEP